MCNSKIEISVVIATYNGEKYIQKQLESLMKQSYKPDEVIIIDDKSKDATYGIIKKFVVKNNLKNWKLYQNKKNIGYKKNFYKGIKCAKGNYIFLCDQDDEWEKNKIELMLKVMKANPQLQALNCAVKIIDANSKEIAYKNQKNIYNCGFLYSKEPIGNITYFTFSYLLKHNISPGCTMVITKQLKNIFITNYDYSLPHDWYLNLLASVECGCAFYNKVLVKYRRHNNNVIGSNIGLIKGITLRTKTNRIGSCEAKENAANTILRYYEIQGKEIAHNNDELNKVLKWISVYKDFFKSPNLPKLAQLYHYSEYYEITKLRIRLWNIIVALKLDDFIIKIVSCRYKK